MGPRAGGGGRPTITPADINSAYAQQGKPSDQPQDLWEQYISKLSDDLLEAQDVYAEMQAAARLQKLSRMQNNAMAKIEEVAAQRGRVPDTLDIRTKISKATLEQLAKKGYLELTEFKGSDWLYRNLEQYDGVLLSSPSRTRVLDPRNKNVTAIGFQIKTWKTQRISPLQIARQRFKVEYLTNEHRIAELERRQQTGMKPKSDALMHAYRERQRMKENLKFYF